MMQISKLRTLGSPLRTTQKCFYSSANTSTLAKTKLYDFHVNNGGKMVPFAGYSMPLQYKPGPIKEHHHTRQSAGLFDVSHMQQSRISGKAATEFLSKLCPSDLASLTFNDGKYSSTLSVLLNPEGGIIDDLMITRQDENVYYVVTNAARKDRDLPWIRENAKQYGNDVKFETMDDQGLVALQGPKSSDVVMKSLGINTEDLIFGKAMHAKVSGQELHIARGGYTGEDGFEISVAPEYTTQLAELLQENQDVMLAGLAARDSLRLEAGLCLYGHDLDETTSPIEGSLTWVVSKNRREPGQFIGVDKVLEHLKVRPDRRRVGFVIQGAPAREGAVIFDESGEQEIGVITSGIPSPTLGKNVAMGYIKEGFHKRGTPVKINVRNKLRDASVEKMPFVQTNYYRGKQ